MLRAGLLITGRCRLGSDESADTTPYITEASDHPERRLEKAGTRGKPIGEYRQGDKERK